jgi:hypothetical protein
MEKFYNVFYIVSDHLSSQSDTTEIIVKIIALILVSHYSISF